MRTIYLSFSILLVSFVIKALDIEQLVSKYTGKNGAGYLQPLADAMGANINSGLSSVYNLFLIGQIACPAQAGEHP